MATQTQPGAARTNEEAQIKALASGIFLLNYEERKRTIEALFDVCRCMSHPDAVAVMDEDRESVAWLLYFLKELVEDDRELCRLVKN